MKILVVDDSKAMRMIVRRSLLKSAAYAGATVIEAENGQQALKQVEAEAPDVILSDWNMPKMDGIELLEALAAKGPHVPFGFMTSESTPEMYARATAAGATFLVSKPFTPESLAAALDGAL
ncbi:MAG: two-component system chemotaxis response regulator CheY [Myxococcota bacterium]